LKRICIVAIACLMLFPEAALSQTRRRTTTRRSAPTGQRAADSVSAGAARVAEQIKTLSRFLYLLGGISKDIAAVDEAARRNQASPAAVQQADKSKAVVRTSLKNVREGLDQLEIDFRVTPALQPYYIKLAGVAAGAAAAEDKAAANQLDQSGRSLLEVVNRLTDVLLEMQKR